MRNTTTADKPPAPGLMFIREHPGQGGCQVSVEPREAEGIGTTKGETGRMLDRAYNL